MEVRLALCYDLWFKFPSYFCREKGVKVKEPKYNAYGIRSTERSHTKYLRELWELFAGFDPHLVNKNDPDSPWVIIWQNVFRESNKHFDTLILNDVLWRIRFSQFKEYLGSRSWKLDKNECDKCAKYFYSYQNKTSVILAV